MIHQTWSNCKFFVPVCPLFQQKFFAFPPNKKVRHSPKIRAVSKKGLAYFLNMRYNKGTRQIEAGRKVVTHLTPLCRRTSSYTTALLRQPLLYSKRRPFTRGGFKGFVSDKCGVGYFILRRFCLSWRKTPTEGRDFPPSAGMCR